MTSICVPDPQTPLVRAMLTSVDCTTGKLLAGGYGAFGASGWAPVVTGLLTIFIGIIGYRLMLGRMRLDAGELVITALKLGLVLTISGSWADYGPMISRALFDGPQQIAAMIVSPAAHQGSALPSNQIDALQVVFDELQSNAQMMASQAGNQSPLLGGIPFATMVMNATAYLLLLSTLGLLLAANVVLSFLLALAPIVIGLFMFDATRGMVQGWVRAMLGASFAPLAVIVTLAIEMPVIEPILVTLARQRQIKAIQPDTAMAAAMIVLVFALATLAAIGAGFMISRGLKWPARSSAAINGNGQVGTNGSDRLVATTASQSRVDRIANAAAATAQRAQGQPRMTMSIRDAATGRDNRAGAEVPAGAPHSATGTMPRHRPRRQLLISRRRQ